MILPIIAYGDPVLRKVGQTIDKDFPNLEQLIADMFETMYHAKGVGLAAPQIGQSIRLFIVDASPFDEDEDDMPEQKNFRRVFINAQIEEEKGTEWAFSEGCLSIPKIREDVNREEAVTLEYDDEHFNHHVKTFNGITARVILHEYDHIEGKLFIDHIKPLKRKLLQGKLNDISKGKVKVDYRMLFPK